jgi:two-component system, chemotaxis family, CheB/CheR fusion protein
MTDETSEEQEAKPATKQGRSTFPIIGIGASAGGIDALKRLFPSVKPDCGMAFVVVQHLDPDHGSVLPEILSRYSSLPVAQIGNDTEVEPNHVYVIPPKATLTIRDGHLMLAPRSGSRILLNSIDEFFTSLATDRAEDAACVILSGTGSDGTLGLRAIKEHGGLTIAQAEAEYDGMMRSAVSTGLVDFVLRPEEIPGKLVEYFQRAIRAESEAEDESKWPEITGQLDQIISLLRTQTSHDFSNYKTQTIMRRVRRRMHVLQIDDIATFVERLRKDNREVGLLFQDLLIGVTSFFRDPEAFAAFEARVMPELFKDKVAEDTIRVWVPGCATGEEAYSIAILLREYAPKSEAPKLQVFASDIDDHGLDIARVGRYPATISKDVPPERLERYFLREDGTYRITADIREICLFSPHNVLRDAPFSKLDLISCRNMLIYLSPELQNRLVPLFHYALLPNGYLFLGTSENVTRHTRLFQTVDKSHRIFRRRPFPDRRIPEFPLTTPEVARRALAPVPSRTPGVEPNLKAVAERQLIERFVPAYVVINVEGDLLQSSSGTGKYLELPSGAPDTNIFSMARPGLRLELRAALHKAVGSGQVVQRRVAITVNGGQQEINLYVQPLRVGSTPDDLYMIVFQDDGLVPARTTEGGEAASAVAEAGTHQLEAELRATRERLQTTTEELEASNEELKSGNEELQSMNEELQSANEELETSKEELQSINEELQTVNAELNSRVEELSRANNDMRNLLESTQIATVFLDRMLNVRGFTPAAKEVFRLVESDTGRPIMHVRARVDSDTLQEDAERVLRTLATIERPVNNRETNTRYVMRILPYRTIDNVINGVVLTFTDITHISVAEAQIERLTHDLSARVVELETLLDLIPVGVMIAENGKSQQVLINGYGARLLGAADDHKGLKPLTGAIRLLEDNKELTRAEQPLQHAARTGDAVPSWYGHLETRAGRRAPVMISATPLFTKKNQVRGAIAAVVDISEHKRTEEQLQLLLHELQHRVKNILATVTSLATRMARETRSVEAFHGAFLSRIAAMGRVHDLLAGDLASSPSLRALIEASLQPYLNVMETNVLLNGDEVRLDASTAASLGMVLHELVTNASKYGALSEPGRHIDVVWTQGDAGGQRLRLIWLERGGPAIQAPGPPGFGTNFVRRSVEYELQGTVELAFEPEGLRCTIEFPLTRDRGETSGGDG